MNGSLLLRSVLLRLWRHKAKTLFMGLGITVAVLATVLLQTVLGSVNHAFSSFIDRAYPADGVVLMAGSGFMGGGPGTRALLRLSDVEAAVHSLGITEWDPVVFIGLRDVKHAGNNVSVSVTGHSEMAESVRRRPVQEGEFFTADEVRSRSKVALIGSTTASTLFPGESPIGAQLFIDNVPYEVKGVLETIGADPHGGDQDQAIWIPYTIILDMVGGDTISGATLIVGDPSRVEEARNEVVEIIRERHQIGEGQADDFSIITPVFIRGIRARTAKTWGLFVPLIAATAFLISTVVILSIMQISIKGRIPEIGLRKAVGARARDLQLQIILEVLLVSAAASLVGLLLAQVGSTALTPMLAAKYGVQQVSPRAVVVLVAVGAAIATGLLGGVWPARRAAKLNPVEALK